MDVADIESREETSLWGSKTEAEGSVAGRVAPGARESWVPSEIYHKHRQVTVTLAFFLNLNHQDNN